VEIAPAENMQHHHWSYPHNSPYPHFGEQDSIFATSEGDTPDTETEQAENALKELHYGLLDTMGPFGNIKRIQATKRFVSGNSFAAAKKNPAFIRGLVSTLFRHHTSTMQLNILKRALKEGATHRSHSELKHALDEFDKVQTHRNPPHEKHEKVKAIVITVAVAAGSLLLSLFHSLQ
jgi:hypothetical protein